MTTEQNPQPTPHAGTSTDQAPQPQAQGSPGPQSQPTAAPGYGYAPPKRLVRRRDDRMLGGVCSGVADYAGIDVTVVRLLTVLGAVFGLGSLVLIYLVMWVVLPEG
jgi:phage shock protein C